MIKQRWIPMVAVAAGLFAASQGFAQVTERDRNADALSQRAEQTEKFGDARANVRAADLHVQSARLRLPGDERAYNSQFRAANLYFYAGKPVQARQAFEDAALMATARGDLMNAAFSFWKAAVVAAETGQLPLARDLADRALALTQSPMMDDDNRVDIWRRFESTLSFLWSDEG